MAVVSDQPIFFFFFLCKVKRQQLQKTSGISAYPIELHNFVQRCSCSSDGNDIKQSMAGNNYACMSANCIHRMYVVALAF